MSIAADQGLEHIIEAANPLLGTSRFLTLFLPESWDLAAGVSGPEVNASHLRHGLRWVANGDFWYIVYHTQYGWAMELHGSARPLNGRRDRPPGAEDATVSGHAAWVTWHTRRRGLPWRRHDVTFMTVNYECPQSERRISLEFSGWCPPEGFRQMLHALEWTRCH